MEGVCNKGTHAASMHAGEGEFVMGTWVRGSTPSVASFPLSISQASRKEMVMPDFMDTRDGREDVSYISPNIRPTEHNFG